jgi:U6 snRNA-associated Sm-like protein LSm6
MEHKRSPADFIKQSLGREVVVKLNDESEYTGVLICLDGTLNIVMEKVEEHKDGQLISKYNKLFLRGNNVLYISPKIARIKRV